MNVLSKKEVNTQKINKRFENKIALITDAYLKGITDLRNNRGHHNNYKDKSEQVAYTLGWNKCSSILFEKFATKQQLASGFCKPD